MFKEMYSSLSSGHKTITIIVTFLIVCGMVKAGYYTIHYGGIDLRQRIVGARLLGSEQSVYFYKWSPGSPEKFIDPNVRKGQDINGITVAPGALYIQAIFSHLQYPALRITWSLFQYLLIILIFCSYLFDKKIYRPDKLLIFYVVGIFFFCSPVWLINIERGQIYILYAFLFRLILFLCTNKSIFCKYLSGVMIAAAIYCRPTFVILLIPLYFAGNRQAIWGFISGFGLLILHAFLNQNLWMDYFKAVGTFTGMRNNAQNILLPANTTFPAVIEGADNLSLYKNDFICGGIAPIDTWIQLVFRITSGYFYVLCYIIIAISLIYIFRKKLHQKKQEQLMLFAFLLYIFAEYIMPAPRGAYNLIQWIFPVLIFLKKPVLRPVYMILLITGLCFINAFPFYFPLIHDIGELLLVICLIKYIWNYNDEIYNVQIIK